MEHFSFSFVKMVVIKNRRVIKTRKMFTKGLRKMKRIILSTMVALMIVLSLGTVASADTPQIDLPQNEQPDDPAPPPPVAIPYYASFTGTVKEILPSLRTADAVQKIVIDDEGESEAVFLVNANTFWASGVTSVKIGDKVTGFYATNMPMILIYPPQYSIEIMVVNLDEDMAVTVDRFNDELTGADGTMQILINENTQVLTPEGDLFSDEYSMVGRLLVVFHDNVDDSMPAKTMASKIFVMYEKAVNPIYKFSPEELEALFPLNGDVVVNGGKIDAPAPYYSNGVAMVPLRAVAEALGFNVAWDTVTQSIRLGVAINLRIGNDYYTVGRMAPIELGTAPELTDGFTYVPVTFFYQVLSGYDAYVSGGQLVIDTLENVFQ